MRGRTVRIYLADGVPGGIITAEIMNWTGKVTVSPRSRLSDLSTRDDVNRTGIYVLSGENPSNPSQEYIYIGESDNVWKRLVNHTSDTSKDFWQRTIVVTSKDQNLTKGHIRYLESRLIQIAAQAQRAQLANGTNPEPSILPESDVADMEYFLEQIQILLPVLGFSFASSVPSFPEVSSSPKINGVESPIFVMNYAGIIAKAREVNGEFVVFAASTARKHATPSLSESHLQIREELLADGKLADSPNPEYWVVTQNLPFTSPSTAASVVGGASLNGRRIWKVDGTDQTYAVWQESQLIGAAEFQPTTGE